MAGLFGQSEEDKNRVLGQINDPNEESYLNSSAAAFQQAAKNQIANSHTMNYGAAQPGVNAQNDAIGLAGGLARGQGPSLSRANMDLGLSRATNNLQAAQAGFGAQGGLGQRNYLNTLAGLQGNVVGQGAVAGAQEQIGNIQNYGALGSAARGQGIQQAGLDAQNAATNRAGALNAINTGYGISADQTRNRMTYDAALMNQGNARAGVMTQQDQGSQNTGFQLLDKFGNLAKGAATAVAGF